MDSIRLQKQIRDNAELLQTYQTSFHRWEEEMREKDAELLNSSSDKLSEDNEENLDEILQHEEADKYKLKGNEYVKSGLWIKALKEYTTAISIYPNDAVYYGNRSYCHLQLEQLVEAENDCNEALELKPDYCKVALRRANIRKKLGNIRGAGNDYNLVLVLDPKNMIALKEYEELYPKLVSIHKQLGLKLPKFVEMNPSCKPAQMDEQKQLSKEETKCSEFQTRDTNVLRGKNKYGHINNNDNKRCSSPKKKCEVIDNKTKSSTVYKPPHLREKLFKNEELNNYTVINVIKNKPPHLRSKMALRKISIEDMYTNSDENVEILF